MIATSTIQAYKDNTKREREEDSRIQFTCLCQSLPINIHKLAFSQKTSSPSLVFLCVSVCLHSPPAPGCPLVALIQGQPKLAGYPNPKISFTANQNSVQKNLSPTEPLSQHILTSFWGLWAGPVLINQTVLRFMTSKANSCSNNVSTLSPNLFSETVLACGFCFR